MSKKFGFEGRAAFVAWAGALLAILPVLFVFGYCEVVFTHKIPLTLERMAHMFRKAASALPPPSPSPPPKLNMQEMKKIWDATRPQYVNGRWVPAKLSMHVYRILKKRAVDLGIPWQDAPHLQRKEWTSRSLPDRLHTHERPHVIAKRIDDIQKALNDMPRLVEQYRKEVKKSKERKDEDKLGLRKLFPDLKFPTKEKQAQK